MNKCNLQTEHKKRFYSLIGYTFFESQIELRFDLRHTLSEIQGKTYLNMDIWTNVTYRQNTKKQTTIFTILSRKSPPLSPFPFPLTNEHLHFGTDSYTHPAGSHLPCRDLLPPILLKIYVTRLVYVTRNKLIFFSSKKSMSIKNKVCKFTKKVTKIT